MRNDFLQNKFGRESTTQKHHQNCTAFLSKNLSEMKTELFLGEK